MSTLSEPASNGRDEPTEQEHGQEEELIDGKREGAALNLARPDQQQQQQMLDVDGEAAGAEEEKRPASASPPPPPPPPPQASVQATLAALQAGQLGQLSLNQASYSLPPIVD